MLSLIMVVVLGVILLILVYSFSSFNGDLRSDAAAVPTPVKTFTPSALKPK